MKPRDMRLLTELATLRADLSASRLAKRQAIVVELERRDAVLRQAPSRDCMTIAETVAMDRYDAWRRHELGKLSVQLAQANAEAQPFRERYSKDFARREVLKRLSKRH